MMRTYTLILLLLVSSLLVEAQTINTTWLAAFTTTKINKKFSIHFDAQWRSGDQYSTMSTLLLRPGLNYHLNDRLVLTAGYGYITNRRSFIVPGPADEPVNVTGYLPEHRLWQQALYTHPIIGKNTITHRLRLEQRFLMQPSIENYNLSADGNTYANRVRYFFRTVIPVKQEFPFKKGLFAGLQNEVMFNFGDKTPVNGKIFDQNRLLLSAGYRIQPKIDVELGYLNQHVKGRADAFVNNHVIQLAAYTRF
ncbi:MAG: DUF2490 domain-containing protein [Flavihumibacter sp.]|nr:DUF2490 domain-containing protein [Flavihumibacter sp.]